ncbi:hypothetical protein [Parvularcula marina]|uniref:Uncharacterized protein n=1 Tax=Parvularcula marina TaxID=2292771 RepID=A0A371RF01_9PROT|nr:hypothetical protein [Parvularcula marina]RFB04024.1 hypothetical protein DX908_01230 [Parvularcula marina]
MKRLTTLAALSLISLLAACSNAPSVEKPAVISFDASRAQMVTALDGLCTSIDEREFNPPEIPGAETHSQIDCQGFDYFGAPRLAEFVFQDDALVVVWILVEESELDGLEEAFIAEFGEPTSKSETITAFTRVRAAVRKDTPEALYYAESVAPLVEGMFAAAP